MVVTPRESAGRRAVERTLVLLLPLAIASPRLVGIGVHRGLLDAAAGFLASHGLAGSGLVLPLDLAEETGRVILLGRALLAIVAGLAVWRLLRLIGLGGVALVAALLVEADPRFLAGDDGGLVGAALLLLAAERAVASRGALRFAFAAFTAALLTTGAVAAASLAASVGWGVARIATGLRGRRLGAGIRLAAGAVIGALVSLPFVAPGVLGALVALGGGWSPSLAWPAGLGSSFSLHLPSALQVGRAAAPVPVVAVRAAALLPLFALALPALLPVPPPRRGLALRSVLGLAAVGFAALPGGVAATRLPLALLAAVTLDDAARGAASSVVGRGFACVLVTGAAFGLIEAGTPPWPALLGAGFGIVAVALASRPLPASTTLLASALAAEAYALFG